MTDNNKINKKDFLGFEVRRAQERIFAGLVHQSNEMVI